MINPFDTYFYQLINQTLTAEWLDFLMVKFSDKLFWVPFYIVIVWFLFKQYNKRSLLILLFIGLSVVASDRISSGIMKPLFHRTRPCLESEMPPQRFDYPCNETGSMPSSHASNHFAIAVFMVLLAGIRKKNSTMLWFLWAFLIAYSRVYVGVHYPTDVIAGAILGIALGSLFHYLYSLFNKKIKWN